MREIQACLRAGIADRATTVGPFLALVNTTSANPFLNYAVPVARAAPTPADVADLVAFFAARDRLPRLEYVRPSAEVDAALVAAGFDVAATLALMALDELVQPPPTPGYEVLLPTDADRLRQAVAVQHSAYGEDSEPDPSRALVIVAAGGCVALAVAADTGEPAGAGLYTAPRFGLVEVAGIGVGAAHRRRGVGGLVAAALTADALSRGHRPFLQVEKDEPARIYQRIGYRVVGEMADARLVGGG